MGGHLGDEEMASFRVNAEVGVRAPLADVLHFDLGLQAGWTERNLSRLGDAAPVGLFTFELRTAMSAQLGPWRPYAGVATGLGVLAPRDRWQSENAASSFARPARHAFAGLGIQTGPGEIVMELGYGGTHTSDGQREGSLSGLDATFGYRLMPDL